MRMQRSPTEVLLKAMAAGITSRDRSSRPAPMSSRPVPTRVQVKPRNAPGRAARSLDRRVLSPRAMRSMSRLAHSLTRTITGNTIYLPLYPRGLLNPADRVFFICFRSHVLHVGKARTRTCHPDRVESSRACAWGGYPGFRSV